MLGEVNGRIIEKNSLLTCFPASMFTKVSLVLLQDEKS